MSEFVLVKFEDNWADEMDVHGFKIYEIEEWTELKVKIAKLNRKMEFCIGTNEELEFKNGKAILKSMTEYKITENEKKFLENIFGNKDRFGCTSLFMNIPYHINEQEEIFKADAESDFEADTEDGEYFSLEEPCLCNHCTTGSDEECTGKFKQ